MLELVIGAIKGDVDTFERVEHDPAQTGPAAMIVAATALLGAIGQAFVNGLSGFILALIGGIVGWIVWSGVSFLLGTKLFDADADMGEMLRVLGFAHAPLLLTIIPIVGFLAAFWTLWVAFKALRAGLDISTGQSLIVAVLGIIVIGLLRFALPFI